MIEAEVIADSLSQAGDRLTTLEVRMPRFILAEFNTHRVFSRSSASSRAIPLKKQISMIRENPALPIKLQYNQPGMQSAADLTPDDERTAIHFIRSLADSACLVAEILGALGPEGRDGVPLGLHKQWVNRYLEPWMWHVVIVSATEWDNFFRQRISPLAQPEFDKMATLMRDAIGQSKPRILEDGDWHTPYIQDWERDELSLIDRVEISAARSARVSYLTHDGKRDLEKDKELYRFLRDPGDGPAHAAPLEHVATPRAQNRRSVEFLSFDGKPTGVWVELPEIGNFVGFDQLRHRVLGF